MKHATSGRRTRGRGNGSRRPNQNRSQIFDSNGPDVRIRGTAHQIHEKYMGLAKDAAAQGEYIMEQNYLQHAEHYQRIINSWEEENLRNKRTQDRAKNLDESKEADGNVEEELALPESILTPAPTTVSTRELEDA